MLIRIYDFAQFITISHGGVIEIYYNITWGGVFPIYYNITMGGGVSRDPKFVLRNIWTAPYRKRGEGCVMQECEHHFGCIWEHGKITLRGNIREYLYKIAAGSYPKIENLQ